MKEVRLGVVMYGGLSLAIYMNGVAQELLHLARATGRPGPSPPEATNAVPAGELGGTEVVYRKLAQLFDPEIDLDRLQKSYRDGMADQTQVSCRFVVDVISGSSAGGINGVFLAKALANNQSMGALRRLWVDEGDIGRLINDGKFRDSRDIPRKGPPSSVLDGARMYWLLLEALEGMEFPRSRDAASSMYVDELDLFVTTTDLEGLILPIKLANGVVREGRHRNVFRFVYATEWATGEDRNDFHAGVNPFLAFAARCTSAFPVAFEPMTLADIDTAVARLMPRTGEHDYTSSSPDWHRFYRDYLPESEKDARNTFPARPFGDGGSLDNKPFSYTTARISRKRADLPVDRKLIYIEPDPGDPVVDPLPAARPDAVKSALDQGIFLPRAETIREDLQVVFDRNRIIERIERSTRLLHPTGLERDIAWAYREDDPRVPVEDLRKMDLTSLVPRYGVAYGGYQRLRVAQVTDDLTSLVARVTNLKEESEEITALRYLIGIWRDRHYTHYFEQDPSPEAQSKSSFTAFLLDYDITFHLRQITFLQRVIDDLYRGRSGAPSGGRDQVFESGTPEWDAFRNELVEIKRALARGYVALRKSGRAIRSRDRRSNPIAMLIWRQQDDGTEQPIVTRDALLALLAIPSEAKRREQAEAIVDTLDDVLQAIGSAIVAELQRARDEAEERIAPALEESPERRLEDPVARARTLCRRYRWLFLFQDIVTYPMRFGTDVGESDAIEVLRISPRDAPSLRTIGGRIRRKTAGGELGHFGGFFDRVWRQNDILWGRLDAADCLITAIVPLDHPERAAIVEALVKEAQTAIIAEDFRQDDRTELVDLLARALSTISPDEDPEAALAKLVEKEVGSPINTKFQAILRTCLEDDHTLYEYFKDHYEVSLQTPPGPLARSAARGTHVMGEVLRESSRQRGVRLADKPMAWLTRFGQLLSGVTEVAIPGRLSHLFYRHWSAMMLVFAGLLIVGGIVFTADAVQRFGWLLLFLTLLAGGAVILTGDLMRGGSAWRVLLRLVLVAAALIVVVLAFLELKHVPRDVRFPRRAPFESFLLGNPRWVAAILGGASVLMGLAVWLHGWMKLRRPQLRSSILRFELAGTRKRAREIMAAWGRGSWPDARTGLWLALGFLVLLAVALLAACFWASGVLRPDGVGLATVGIVLGWAQVVAGVLGAAGNITLRQVLRAGRATPDEVELLLGDDSKPQLARWCALARFVIMAAGAIYFVAGLIRYWSL